MQTIASKKSLSVLQKTDAWSTSQKQRVEILFKQYDDIKRFYYLSLRLGSIYSTPHDKDVTRGKMALWFNDVEDLEYPQFNTDMKTFTKHYERIFIFLTKDLPTQMLNYLMPK